MHKGGGHCLLESRYPLYKLPLRNLSYPHYQTSVHPISIKNFWEVHNDGTVNDERKVEAELWLICSSSS